MSKALVTAAVAAICIVGLASHHKQAADPVTTTPHGTGPVVTGTEFERDSTTTGTHYAECAAPTGDRYRVVLEPGTSEHTLHNGQPCPTGRRVPMPQDEYPALYAELNRHLPYRGGNPHGPCGAWETEDKQEARDLARTCPPLIAGDLH